MESCLEGPLILRPVGNETSFLWDIVLAFREGVEVGISQENYTSGDWKVLSTVPGLLGSKKLDKPYDLSLRSSPRADWTRVRGTEVYADDQEDTAAHKGYEISLTPSRIHVAGEGGHNQRNVLVRAYAVKQFSRLRSLCGITEESYRRSLLETGPYVSFQANSKGAARTGAIFFSSRDGSFLVKTIKKEEALTLLRILPQYCSFMESNGLRSLLTRFCGMYDVCLGDKCRTFVVMNSVFPASASKRISKRFDIKGSTVGRACSIEERMVKGNNAVLKDLDLVSEMSAETEKLGMKKGFSLDPARKVALFRQIEKDVAFLKSCLVIDYSLLVGIEPHEKWHARALNASLRFRYKVLGGRGVDGSKFSPLYGARGGHPVVYYLGLIDFLQPFNGMKLMEYKLKSLVYEKDTFSCVPPDIYARRLVSFLDTVIIS